MTDHGPETISEARAAAKQEEKKGRARIPFPLAGEGAFFLFTLGGLCALEEAADRIMPDWGKRGFTSFGVMERLLLDGNSAAVKAAIDCGLKRLDENGKPVPFAEIDPDDIEWPLSDVVEPALQALAVGHFGKTYSEIIEEVKAARLAAEGEQQA